MNRRDFLRRSLYGVAAWPLLVQSSFADEPTVKDLARDMTAARLAKRDLLVFVIPHDDLRWDRGHALGAFLNHGNDAVRARLTAVQVSCATRSAVEKLTRASVPESAGLVLVNLSAVPAAVSTQPLDMPALDLWRQEEDETWEAREKRETAMVVSRIHVVERALMALLPSPVADRAAALADVKARIVDAPPTGANWARSSGCGTIVEGRDDNMGIGCGMGHIPALTSRFLLFPSDA